MYFCFGEGRLLYKEKRIKIIYIQIFLKKSHISLGRYRRVANSATLPATLGPLLVNSVQKMEHEFLLAWSVEFEISLEAFLLAMLRILWSI